MDKLNMLSARKVKLHGMTSTKWTTKDKITQYKGLINLYLRDNAIMKMDTYVTKRKQTKELKQLRKEIEKSRKALENAVKGDKQKLRNTLAEHRDMQLVYQDYQSRKVIDAIHQINFHKRKELDKLAFRLKQKSDVLIDYKLELAVLEDRLKYSNLNEFPIEKQSAVVTGKVQDAILKKEAAQAIKQTFLQIIDIMKKDALYFDAILATMRGDSEAQGSCMINATKLGQVATEYLDDRKNEYKCLEKAVKRDMQSRKEDLMEMQKKVCCFANNIKQLLRRDSDLNLGVIKIEKTDSEIGLRESFSNVVDILNILKSSTFVSNFDMIYPCFNTQLNHYERLANLVQEFEEKRDILSKKARHAEVMRDTIRNSMVGSTAEYKTEKQDLISETKAQRERQRQISNILKIKIDLLAKVRISLNQFQQMVRIINMKCSSSRKKSKVEEESVMEEEEDEIDGVQIIANLKKCFAMLMSRPTLKKPMSRRERLKNFGGMIHKQTRVIPLEVKVSDESLLEGMLEISNVPTREEIKRISSEIVETNTKTEEYILAHGNL